MVLKELFFFFTSGSFPGEFYGGVAFREHLVGPKKMEVRC
jgi:hypothetical protein